MSSSVDIQVLSREKHPQAAEEAAKTIALVGELCVLDKRPRYPEEKPEHNEGDGWEAEGALDTSAWERKEGQGLLTSVLDYVRESRNTFEQEKGSFFYIAYMGVLPGQQGGGLGSQMLTYMCDMCDQRGKWMYLESCCDTNMRLYQRFGFELLHRRVWTLPDHVPGVEYTMRIMARPPPTCRTSTIKEES